ncbi:MAG: DUF1353 domain-containing protein [Afipia sp.]|nr:DUF1353 domain-containing protein [Afipia sp.]
MSRFTGELTITQLDVDYRTWRLEQPLVYEVGDENSGHMIEVHKLFETDGASVPRIFWALLPTWGKYSRAAVVHDYLYNELREGTEPHPEAPTRQRADAIFLEAMAVCGVGFMTRWIMWAAVRVFDSWHCRRPARWLGRPTSRSRRRSRRGPNSTSSASGEPGSPIRPKAEPPAR